MDKEFLKKMKSSLENGEKNEFVDKINQINSKADGVNIDESKINVEKEKEELPLSGNMNKELQKVIKKYNDLMESLIQIDDEKLSEEEKQVLEEIRDVILK